MTSKLLTKEGCKNKNCSSWNDKCQRAVVFRIAGNKAKMVTDRSNTNPCELFLERKFKGRR